MFILEAMLAPVKMWIDKMEESNVMDCVWFSLPHAHATVAKQWIIWDSVYITAWMCWPGQYRSL